MGLFFRAEWPHSMWRFCFSPWSPQPKTDWQGARRFQPPFGRGGGGSTWVALVSKAPKGLLVLRVHPRFCTGRSISLTLEGRQLSPRGAIHTSLQLRDNLLRYLCTVKIPRPLNSVTGQAGPLIRYILQEAMFLVNRRGLCLPSSFPLF